MFCYEFLKYKRRINIKYSVFYSEKINNIWLVKTSVNVDFCEWINLHTQNSMDPWKIFIPDVETSKTHPTSRFVTYGSRKRFETWTAPPSSHTNSQELTSSLKSKKQMNQKLDFFKIRNKFKKKTFQIYNLNLYFHMVKLQIMAVNMVIANKT